jgi:hypothetical protein
MALIDWELQRKVKDIARTYGFTVKEVYYMLRFSLMAEIDPLSTEEMGEVHRFDRDGVPDPYATVDYFKAEEVSRRHAKQCEEELKRNPSLETLAWIFCNGVKWARFWAVRARTAEQRAKCAKEVEEAEAQLEELKAKALARGLLKIVEKLDEC